MAESPTYSMRWQKHLKEQKEQITTLKEQLAKHGGHTAGCSAYHHVPSSQYECDCGWVELEKERG